MRKRVLKAALICVLCFITGPARAQDDFPREVLDATGNPIAIPEYPQIVAVAGEVPALAGVMSSAEVRQVDPASAAPNWSEVGLLVTPDWVTAAYPALIEGAQAAGVPVFRVAFAAAVADWRATVHRLGRATGRDAAASATIRRLDVRLRVVAEALRDVGPVRVLALTPEAYTFGQAALFTELITTAGGINAAAEAGFDDFRQVDDAAIRDLAPDVILLSPAWDESAQAAFTANPAYVDVPAIRTGRVYRLPFSPTQPADPGAAVVSLALLLHPAALLLP